MQKNTAVNPYPRLSILLQTIFKEHSAKHATREDVLAVCRAETSCDGWFHKCCDPLYKANMIAMTSRTGIAEGHILEAIQMMDPLKRPMIPKFRYETVWERYGVQFGAEYPLSRLQKALFCCSWGIGQKGAPFLVAHLKPKERLPYLMEFMHSEKMQLVQVVKDLDVLLAMSQGKRDIAFTRYNAGPSAHVVTGYGAKVENYRKQLLALKEVEKE